MATAVYARDVLAGVQLDNEFVTTDTEEGRLLRGWLDEGVPRLTGLQRGDTIDEVWIIESPDSAFFGLALTEHLESEGWETWYVPDATFSDVKAFKSAGPLDCARRDKWLLEQIRGYNPDQPRVPAGQPGGGQFGSGGGGPGSIEDYEPPKKDESGKIEPGSVGKLGAVETGKWKKENSSAQWALKKIAKLEEMAAKGDWDGVVQATYKPSEEAKVINAYQKGVIKAGENLLKLKDQQAQQPPAKAELKSEEPQVVAPKGWTKLGGKLGTEEGGTYTGPDGKKYYVKQPTDPGRAHNEVLAAKLYEAAGGNVVKAHLLDIDNKLSVATEWQEGAQHVDFNDPDMKNVAAADFALHAWTANWDAVGAGSENPMDNIKLTEDGKLTLVDAGGALEYNGMGGSGKKPEGSFGKKVDEWDSLRDPSINPTTAKVFGEMTPQQLIDSAEKLKAIDNEAINDIVQKFGGGTAIDRAKLAATMIARKADILKRADSLKEKIAEQAKPKIVESAKTEEYATPKQDAPKAPEPTPEPSAAAPSIPPPPVVTSQANQSMNVKLQKLYDAAKTGDVEAVEAIATNANAKNKYSQWQHNYKQQLLATMKEGGVSSAKSDDVHGQTQEQVPAPAPKQITIKASDFPSDPQFVTGNQANKEANEAIVSKAKEYAAAGDLAALQSMTLSPSPKLQAWHSELVANVTQQLNPPPEPTKLEAEALAVAAKCGEGMAGAAMKGAKHIGYWAEVGNLGGVPDGLPSGTWNPQGDPKLWEAGQKIYEGMPSKLSQAIYAYTGSAYGKINGELRTHEPGPQALDAANAVTKHGMEIPAGTKLSRKYYGDASHIHEMQNAVGKVLKDAGIVSASTNPNVWSGNVKMELTVGPGVKGIPVKNFSHYYSENEIVFPPNQSILVTKVTKEGSTIKVEATIMPFQEGQCCPP